MTRAIRVLVADDEKNLRELMVRELARNGATRWTAWPTARPPSSGCARRSYDVVVLDMKMPRKAGHRGPARAGRGPPSIPR